MISPRIVYLLLVFVLACILPSVWAEEAGAIIDEEHDEYVDPEAPEPADPEAPEPALLVAYKNIKTEKVVQGCNVTISVSLFNVGKGAAAEVFVEDALPPDFELVEGSLKSSFKNLDPGASVDMEYIAIPSVGDQRFLVRPAKIVYQTAKEESLRQLLSTTPYMEILSTRQNIELHLVKVGKYVSLGVLRTRRDWQNSIAVLFVTSVAIVAYAMWSSVSQKRADALRRAAERDLGVASK